MNYLVAFVFRLAAGGAYKAAIMWWEASGPNREFRRASRDFRRAADAYEETQCWSMTESA